jgi:branched-chain amino acid transport system substrate-binding protein
MMMGPGRSTARSAMASIVLVLALSFTLAACGSGDGSTSTGASTAAAPTTGADTTAATSTEADASASTEASKCGLGNGEKATGEPVKLGAIVTKQPGTDFTDISAAAKAYFDCVNANGGINGRPIQYSPEPEQTDPGQVASLAKKLIESDNVVGMVGNTSLIDCAVNHTYYEAKGFYVINAGIAPECYSTPNSAAVNMGARYSTVGATQWMIKQDVKKLVLDQANVPGSDYVTEGFLALAKDAGLPTQALKENVPIQDANSVALKLVQAAGDGGGVVLNFTPPEALKILQAATQQGLQDRVKWACSTPCNTDFLADALGSAWNGKLGVNAELNLTSADGPDSALYRSVLEQYAPKLALGSFSQMGFIDARIATEALLGIDGDITPKTANAAFQNVKDFKTDILCKPWYYGKAPAHVPNNTDRTATPKDGKMVELEGCTEISAVDPGIAKIRDIEKKDGLYQPVG